MVTMKFIAGRAAGSLLALIALVLLAMLASGQTRSSLAANQEVPNNPLSPAAPIQPIEYSHKTHLALGLNCGYCHTNPSAGALMTFPPTATCMKCHAGIATDKPDIKKLTEFNRTGTPVPWVRVYAVRPGLRWSHRIHLDAGKKCVACHGDVAQLDRMSEITSVTTMYSCLSCHQKNQAKTECSTCHSWPTSSPESVAKSNLQPEH
jgi:Cytochrome c7 and related cytochrome c